MTQRVSVCMCSGISEWGIVTFWKWLLCFELDLEEELKFERCGKLLTCLDLYKLGKQCEHGCIWDWHVGESLLVCRLVCKCACVCLQPSMRLKWIQDGSEQVPEFSEWFKSLKTR